MKKKSAKSPSRKRGQRGRTRPTSKRAKPRKGTSRSAAARSPQKRPTSRSVGGKTTRPRPVKAVASSGPAGAWGGISSEAVARATGRSWSEWIALLDQAGARKWDHATIAVYLHDRLGVGDWWSQMVTVGYEQAVGKRVPHQKADGFSASASRTLGVPVSAVYQAWTNAAIRSRWLPEDAIQITRMTPNKSIRGTADDGRTRLDVNLYAKGANKSRVAVQQEKLRDTAEVTRMKEVWKARLDALQVLLEPPS